MLLNDCLFQGGGFDCADNSTSGDGKWNNIESQRDWILAQMQRGGPKGSLTPDQLLVRLVPPGEIELREGFK